MRVLGIESSADETGVSLIEASGSFPGPASGSDFRFRVLGNALTSQMTLHSQYGGIFPNLAKREHSKAFVPLLMSTLKEAGLLIKKYIDISIYRDELGRILQREPELLKQLTPFLESHAKPDIDAIAVTAGPGLEPALWVGINFAKALAKVWDLPLVAVNHMEGHIMMSMAELGPYPDTSLQSKVSGSLTAIAFPVLALLVSGGHTELVLSKQFGTYELIGQTRDDAAGEAFDKVARLLGLPYPGGPEISRLAAQAREQDFKGDFSFTRPMLHDDNFDFSFSGLKTAVRNLVVSREMTDVLKLQVAREFEECVADVLIEKALRAVDRFGINTVVVGGGVSANAFIRQQLAKRLADEGDIAKLLVPPPQLATDNALMIALAGYFHATKSEFADLDSLVASGNLKLA